MKTKYYESGEAMDDEFEAAEQMEFIKQLKDTEENREKDYWERD